MKALILGCSHAAGSEMAQEPNIKIDNPALFENQNSFPALIAQQLGYTAINCAVAGGSNDAMFGIFCQHLPELASGDIVIACWTGISRIEIRNEVDDEWLPIIAGQPCRTSLVELQQYVHQWTKFGYCDQSAILNKIKNITALNSMANSRAIRVINIDSFWPVEPVDISWASPENFWDWAIANHFDRTPNGHFFLPAHQAFADTIVGQLAANFNTV